jgi:hypothetical protein
MTRTDPEFYINSIVEYSDDADKVAVLRILSIFPQDKMLGVINLYAEDPEPFLLDISSEKILDSLQTVKNDPYKHLLLLEDSHITPGRLTHRDHAWANVQPILFSPIGSIRYEWFYPNERRKLIKARATEINQLIHAPDHEVADPIKQNKKGNSNKFVKERTIYRYAITVMIKGLHPNALLNGFDKVGTLKPNEDGAPKTRVQKNRPGRNPNDEDLYENEKFGIIITPKIKEWFIQALDAGIKRQETIKDVHIDILDKHFSSGVNSKGEFVHLPEASCPTEWQLRNVFHNLYKANAEKYEILRHGKRHFNLNTRPFTGKTMFMVGGPGAVYQGDSTPLPYLLTSSLNPKWAIKKQHLYTVIDCNTELYVGWSLGYHQSWAAAQSALFCAFSDKKNILERYGLLDLLDAFPLIGVCQKGVFDNGPEWGGYNSGNIPAAELANAEAYRPDLKGGVEALIGSLQIMIEKTVRALNYTKPDKNGKSLPILPIDEFRYVKMIIQEMAEHNRNHWIENYPLRREMILRDVSPVPVKLCEFGKPYFGAQKVYPEEWLAIKLLPRTKEASIDRTTILYRGRHYFPKSAPNRNELILAAVKGKQKVEISYLLDDYTKIYRHLPDGGVEEYELSERDKLMITQLGPDNKKTLLHAAWSDIDIFEKHFKHAKKGQQHKRRQDQSNKQNRIKNEYADSVAAVNQATKGMSHKQRTANITEHTALEEAFQKSQKSNSTGALTPTHSGNESSSNYIPIPDYQEEIDKLNKESKEN